MKLLYLARHAKSSWKNMDLSDIDRPLNKRGKKDAPFMGKILSKKGINPDLIISSPAKRARKTALVIAEEISYPINSIQYEDNVYESSSRELLEFVKSIDDEYNSVMIFGHNPGFTMLHNYLCSVYIKIP